MMYELLYRKSKQSGIERRIVGVWVILAAVCDVDFWPL